MGSGSSRPGTAPPSYLTPDDNLDSGEVVTAAEIRRENNESILLLGGIDGDNAHGAMLTSVEQYTNSPGVERDWKMEFPPLPEPRAGLVAGALEDCLVVAGGLEAVEPKRKVSGACWALVGRRRGEGTRWLAIPAMPHPVALAGAVVVRGEELWVFGGKDRRWEATDHIQIFTLTHGWRVIEGGLGRPMAKVCAVLHDDWVYLIDGETASRYSLSERALEDLPSPAEDFSQAGAGLAQVQGGEALVVAKEDCAKWIGLPYQEGRAGDRDTWQRLFNLPADKEKSPTVLSLGGKLYVGGGADTDGQAQDSVFQLEEGGSWSVHCAPFLVKRHTHASILLSPDW